MFFHFFLNHSLIFFNPYNCAHLFPTAELTIPTGTSTKEAKAEIETPPVTIEVSVQYNLKSCKHFCVSY